jgi:two-component system nitrate/nitrite response regulator NarL
MVQSNKTINVVLIDDHKSMLWGLEKLIDGQIPKMRVAGMFTNYTEASLKLGELSPDIILLDLDLGTEQGVEIIPRLLELSSAKILILTGSRDTDLHDKAIIAGAKGIIEKEHSTEKVLMAIERVHEGQYWMDNSRLGSVIMKLSLIKKDENNMPDQKRIASLSPRELHVIAVVTARADVTGRFFAKELHLSENTLRNHLSSIYSKLEISNRLELWDFAHKYALNKINATSENN